MKIMQLQAVYQLATSLKSRFGISLFIVLLAGLLSGGVIAADVAVAAAAKGASGPIGYLFTYIASNPFVFLFLSIAIGYPFGKITIKGINLGFTAGTLDAGRWSSVLVLHSAHLPFTD